jgi:hypothetical protein
LITLNFAVSRVRLINYEYLNFFVEMRPCGALCIGLVISTVFLIVIQQPSPTAAQTKTVTSTKTMTKTSTKTMIKTSTKTSKITSISTKTSKITSTYTKTTTKRITTTMTKSMRCRRDASEAIGPSMASSFYSESYQLQPTLNNNVNYYGYENEAEGGSGNGKVISIIGLSGEVFVNSVDKNSRFNGNLESSKPTEAWDDALEPSLY